MSNSWDRTRYRVTLNGKYAEVLAVKAFNSGEANTLLVRFEDEEVIWAIRWSAQAAYRLPTNELDEAIDIVESMDMLEASNG